MKNLKKNKRERKKERKKKKTDRDADVMRLYRMSGAIRLSNGNFHFRSNCNYAHLRVGMIVRKCFYYD